MQAIARWIGYLGIIATTTFVSGYAALIGAQAGGLGKGGWNLQLLPPLVCGWLGGFMIALICLAAGAMKNWDYALRLFIALITPVFAAFGISLAVYLIILGL